MAASTKRIGVLGAGSWGVTLASMLSEKGVAVTLWEFNPEQAKQLAAWRALSFFPHLTIPKDVIITSELKSACEDKDLLLFAVPSHTLRETAKKVNALKPDLSDTIVVSATKGIETQTLKRMSEIIAAELPGTGNRVTVLSGPSHAEEVSQKMPTTVTAASASIDAAQFCQDIFMTSYFRVYTHSDVVGVETGGALKNIFAIAAGITDGLGFGDNTKAALVTRGLREIIKLGTRMGGQTATYHGLTGMGDLIVTCFSRHSRNHALGEKIGKGKSIREAEKELIMVAEGVKTAQSAHDLAGQYGLDLPIIQQMYEVLYEAKSPKLAVQQLMLRDAKPEMELYE
jgi:glycerol-3-phosphate dehydrogenase (NAD(P)+)